MTTIREDAGLYTVVTRLHYDPEVKYQVRELVERSLPIFKRQLGFVSLSVHESTDGTEIMTYLQWRSRSNDEDCLKSHDWDDLNQEWNPLLESGKARIERQAYKVHRVLV